VHLGDQRAREARPREHGIRLRRVDRRDDVEAPALDDALELIRRARIGDAREAAKDLAAADVLEQHDLGREPVLAKPDQTVAQHRLAAAERAVLVDEEDLHPASAFRTSRDASARSTRSSSASTRRLQRLSATKAATRSRSSGVAIAVSSAASKPSRSQMTTPGTSRRCGIPTATTRSPSARYS